MIENFTHALPLVAVIAAACAFLGWAIRGSATKPAVTLHKSTPNQDKSQQERVKNLEATLEKSKAAHKTLKAELENLQTTSVSKARFEQTTAELETARKTFETEAKRIPTLETELKKAQETLKNLNARANEADKAQKARSFAFENELSTAREQLSILQNRPNDSAELHAEIERLRESVAVSSRFAGEVRKREALTIEALEKAEAKLAGLNDPSRPIVSQKIGPVQNSGRIAAAKAEVLRLIAINQQKPSTILTEEAPVIHVEAPAITEEAPVITEEAPVITEEAPAITEEAPAITEETPVITEEAPAITEEAPVITEEAPAILEEAPVIIEEEAAVLTKEVSALQKTSTPESASRE